MARRIDTVEARGKLPAQRAPHWMRLHTGCTLGFRKIAPTSIGSWLAKVRDASTGKTTWRSLGTFEKLPAHERFRAAKDAAEELARHVEQGGSTAPTTVGQACERYVEMLRGEGRCTSADDARARFDRWVTGTKLERLELRKLTDIHLTDWRHRLIAADVVTNPHAPAHRQIVRRRAPSSVNRDMAPLRAALRLAKRRKAVVTDSAWATALAPIEKADRQRGVYLDRQQRAALIQHAPDDLARLLRGLALVPLRPGALAALTVADFDRRLGSLRIGTDKAGADRRIQLPPTTAAFFAEQARDKLPTASLFARADGAAWDKDSWKKPIKAAAAAAGLPDGTVAYALRHSAITDLAVGGLDLMTVARLAGTSIAMIEKHYGHLRNKHAAEALERLVI